MLNVVIGAYMLAEGSTSGERGQSAFRPFCLRLDILGGGRHRTYSYTNGTTNVDHDFSRHVETEKLLEVTPSRSYDILETVKDWHVLL